MITEDKVTEIFCMADDFCKFFDAMTTKYTLKPTGKRKYHRNSTMSKAEVMLIMILFHDSGYRCFKHFYLEKVCKHLRHLFPKVVSYNRIVELESDVAIPLTLFIKKGSVGQMHGYKLRCQHTAACLQKPKNTYTQGFQRHSPKREMLYGLVLRFQIAFDLQ